MTTLGKTRNTPKLVAPSKRNYPINQWWVTPISADRGSKPIRRWLPEVPEPSTAEKERRFELCSRQATPPGLCETGKRWFFSGDYGYAKGTAGRLEQRINTAVLRDNVIGEATEDMVAPNLRGDKYFEFVLLSDRDIVEACRLLRVWADTRRHRLKEGKKQ